MNRKSNNVLLIWKTIAICVSCILVGCDSKYQLTGVTVGEFTSDLDEETIDGEPQPSTKKPMNRKSAGYEFEAPQRIKAGDEFVKVESPGYACPTLADLDGDDKLDLVVGQFHNGHMKFFKNVSTDKKSLKFAAGKWLKTGGEQAVVPGVW